MEFKSLNITSVIQHVQSIVQNKYYLYQISIIQFNMYAILSICMQYFNMYVQYVGVMQIENLVGLILSYTTKKAEGFFTFST